MKEQKKSSRVVVVAAAVLLLVVTLFFALRSHKQRAVPSPESNTLTAPASEKAAPLAASARVQPPATVPSPSATPARASAPAPLSRAEKLSGAVEAMNVPVVFFGKMVDQDNAPLAGVKVRASVRSWHVIATSDGDATFAPYEAMSGIDGSFQIDGGRGNALTIEALEKEGYEPEPKALQGFGYTTSDPLRPDPNNPVVFRMWKAEAKAQLITGGKRFSLVPDGRTYTIDLLTGAISESATAEGDLRVSIRRPETAAWGQRYDWMLDVQAINGGLVEQTDGSSAMFRAPEDGYAREWRLDTKAADESWSYGTGQKRFYLKSRGGRNYGRLEVEAYAYYLQNKQGRLNLTWAVNPAGDRLLR
jgi:hypothetical protein